MGPATVLGVEEIKSLPKVALHDHLDGALRPTSIIEHCATNGHTLPTQNPDELRRWFFDAADSGSLVRYLKTFDHTVAAMQTADQLARVAHEFVLDQAADGVIYAEARYAPEQHTQQGLKLHDVEAVDRGLFSGIAEAEDLGMGIVVQQTLTSMRHVEPTIEIADLALRYRRDGVCGFDIAGAEDGFPPSRFEVAFNHLKHNNAFFTIHAGEAFGLPSIWEAVQLCGTNRLGHGVRIVDDITLDERGHRKLGDLASFVRDTRIPLELCPSSNLQTSIADHPIGVLKDLGFRITVNCDIRLMSNTTMSREFAKPVDTFGWNIDDIEWATMNAISSCHSTSGWP